VSALVSRLAVGCVLAGVLAASSVRADADTDADGADAMPSSLPDDPTLVQDEVTGPPLRFELNFVGALNYRPSADSGSISYGFGFTYGMGWGDIPLTLGLNFFSLNTSEHVSSLAFVSPADGAVVLADQKARERTMHFDMWLRLQPAHWPVRPYVEGFWGAELVQTQYSLRVPADDPAAVSGDTLSDQRWLMSFGWGAGIDFWGLFNANHTLSLTLGVRQFLGSDADFKRRALIGGGAAVADYAYATKGLVFMLGVVSVFDMGVARDPHEPHRFD
jgi:hypothetical protein